MQLSVLAAAVCARLVMSSSNTWDTSQSLDSTYLDQINLEAKVLYTIDLTVTSVEQLLCYAIFMERASENPF